MTLKRWISLSCLSAVLVLAVAACGGGSESGSSATTSGEGDSTSASEAGDLVVAPPPTSPPTETPITEPLSKAPPKGKKVIFLQCELPSCATFVDGMREATGDLGWEFEAMVFDNADPGSGMAQAVAQKPDFIAITGIPIAAMKSQMKAAQDAGIPVVSCATTEQPSPDVPYGFASQCGGSLVLDAEYIGAWIANDSGGEASVLGITIPQFPVLNTESDYFESQFGEECQGCSYEQLDLTTEDAASGGIPAKVIAQIQSHPDIDYVYSTFNDLVNGLPQALAQAGLSDVKVTGAAANEVTIREIGKTQAAWTTQPNEYMSWVMVDTMARLAAGDELPADYQEQIYKTPTWVIDSTESVELLKPYGYEWPGPGNGAYKDVFRELWQIG